MDHKGHPWPVSGHLHRPKDRRDYYRYSQQDRVQNYPPLVHRERDRHWADPDPCYRANFTDHPARLEQYPYNSHLFPYDHGRSDHQRPQSRHGYDYPPHSHWDYRENYGYYDDDYYRGQHGQQDTGQWDPQYSHRTDQHHVRNYKQDHLRSSYSEVNRYDQGRDNSQHYLSNYEENPSRENVEGYCLGTLESSKTSGLSSSSYELSQYINGAEHTDPVPQPDEEHEPVPHMSAPLKYSIPHAVVSFGHAGQLIQVTPNFSTQKNVSQLKIHSLEVILSETEEQQEMRNFPGPLTREDLHKVDAIEFAHQKAGACMRDEKLHDKSSAALLWNLLILLCRHNGQIVGSDIAELLMQCSHSDGSQESDAPTLIDFSESPTAEAPPQKEDDMLTGNSSSFSSDNSEKALQSYTQLLLAGRKKEALESAMSSGLWGHALFLASKMNNRSYTTVLNRFTGQLAASDPLQTLFHLLSGRIPAVAMCCGNDKSGDWRPHLSMMLSNETGDPAVHQKAIITMGDTLASRGLVHAAHMCYLTAGVPFGPFTQKAERLVLLGSSHKQSFEDFATNSAIQCTELYEYCQTLGNKCFLIPSFQVYKFLYACRLFDCGLTSQAFHYCEVVGQAILRQREPFFVLTGEVIKLADRLRYSEGQFSEASVSAAMQEPDWLKQLRARHHSFQMGNYDCTETHQSAPEGCAHEDRNVYSESGSDNLRSNIQSPEPELLYIRDSEDQEGIAHQTEGIAKQMTAFPWDIRGAQEWPLANPPIPASIVYVPPVPAAASSQDLSYHNTDSAEVRAACAYCPQSDLPSAAEGAGSSSGANMTLGVDISHQGNSQQSMPQSLEPSEQVDTSPQQSKRGWFSGWFQSKPKDFQKQTPERGSPAQTVPPPTAGCQQPSSAGLNPFSRKSGSLRPLKPRRSHSLTVYAYMSNETFT